MWVRRIVIGVAALSDRKFWTIWSSLLDVVTYMGRLRAYPGPRYETTRLLRFQKDG